MFQHLRGERSYVICPNQKMKEPLLTSQDTFAGEAGKGDGGEEETTGDYFYRSG